MTADTMTKDQTIALQAAEIERLGGLLRTSKPFVEFNAVELREMLEHPLPPSAQPGAAEQIKRRIADIEKLVADIDEAIGE